jgi:splicing factor 4
MDKGLFANDGSFMERFKQMQQEKEKAAPAATGASAPAATAAAPKPVTTKTPIVIPMNKRPLEVQKKAAPVLSGGKLAFSLKKNKAPILPVKFGAEEDDDQDDASGVKREDQAKRHKTAVAPPASAPAGAVGNHFFSFAATIVFLSNNEVLSEVISPCCR